MRLEEFWVDAPGEVQIFARAWLPEGEPVGVVQVAHGMAEHGARYERLADALTAAGWACVVSDHRGHGRTASEARGHMADRHGWDKVVNDLLRVTTVVKDTFGPLPLVLLGHSWGSLLARDYAMRWGHLLSGLVLIGTAGDPGLLGTVGKNVAKVAGLRGRRRPSRLMDKLTFGSYNKAFAPNRTDFDWLSRDEAAVDAYVADPDCGFVCSAQFFADMVEGVRRVNNATNVALVPKDLPILVLAGDRDPVGDAGQAPRGVAAAYEAAGVRDVELHLEPEARHELLHELNAETIMSRIVAWLSAHVTDKENR